MRAVAGWAMALASTLAGCSGDWFPHTYGTATLAWTIDGRSDQSLCAQHDARFVHVVVRDGDRETVADEWAPCRELSVRYVLRRGWHQASLVLTDANRASLATRETGDFHVDGDRDVLVVVDLSPPSIDETSGDEPH